MNNLNMQFKNNPIHNGFKQNKILRNKLFKKKYKIYKFAKHKMLLKGIKEGLYKKKIFYVHGLEDNIVKMGILPKLMCRYNEKPVRNPADFFIMDKLSLKFIWNSNKPKPVKLMLKRMKKISLFLNLMQCT